MPNFPPVDIATYVNLVSSKPVWRALDRPGLTTVVGAPGSGKTALAQMIVNDRSAKGRRRLVTAASHGDFQSAMNAARAQLGGTARWDDVVIIDGVDELNPIPSPEEIRYFTQQPWLTDVRLILTGRP
jgi:pantothenate kinase-related protein Tda10